MVLQKNLIDNIILPELLTQSYSLEVGTSASVGYTDNSLDSVVDTVSSGFSASQTGNEIVVTSLLTSTAGVGTINAMLLKGGSDAMNKCLFTEFVKGTNEQVSIKIKTSVNVI